MTLRQTREGVGALRTDSAVSTVTLRWSAVSPCLLVPVYRPTERPRPQLTAVRILQRSDRRAVVGPASRSLGH